MVQAVCAYESAVTKITTNLVQVFRRKLYSLKENANILRGELNLSQITWFCGRAGYSVHRCSPGSQGALVGLLSVPGIRAGSSELRMLERHQPCWDPERQRPVAENTHQGQTRFPRCHCAGWDRTQIRHPSPIAPRPSKPCLWELRPGRGRLPIPRLQVSWNPAGEVA